MVIVRDRYLDDSNQRLVSLALQSRTVGAHTRLTALTSEQQEALGRILAGALDEIERLLTGPAASLASRSTPAAGPAV